MESIVLLPAKRIRWYDEISMPRWHAALHELYFFYNEGLYISKQYSSKSGSSALSFSSRFACGMPRGLKAPLWGLCCRRWSQWLIKSVRNWFKSKQILLLSTWQKNYIFLTTNFQSICRKTLQSAYKNYETEFHSGPHTKITNGIIH
jgi:hypothetical protein